MRFTITNDLQKKRGIRWLISGAMLLTIAFLVGHLLLEAIQLGWYPHHVLQTVAGNEEEFIDPLPFEELLLKAHTNLFFAIIILAIVASAYVRVTSRPTQQARLIAILFASALLAQISLLLIPLWGMPAVWGWMVTSLLWHLIGSWMALTTLWYLVRQS